MSALAERPGPRPAELRVTLTGLKLAIGRRDGTAGFQVTLEPSVAVALAHDLLDSATVAIDAGNEALADLTALTEADRDG